MNAPCQRCHGSGLGNVCFPNRVALIQSCSDSAEQITEALCSELAELPTDEARRRRLDGMAKHHPAQLVDRLRRRVWKLMQGRADV